ncbi:MAG: CotH kinase family protein [Bacteroidota bacterium]
MIRTLLSIFLGVLCLSPVFSQENFDSSPLPIIVLNTQGQEILDDPRIIARMGIISNEDGNRNLLSAPFSEYDGRISIEIRGSSSQFFPKKGFGLETQLEDGSNRNVSLLGMPRENDWILHGPFSDKSLLRNHLAFQLGRKLSQYAPRTRLVELMINNEYQGVYVFMEKIKRDKNRVDIARLESTQSLGDTISGGYIIKLDKGTGSGEGDGWTSSEGSFFQYEYPKPEDINFVQERYIRSYVDSLEAALFGINYQDPEEGFRKYLDVPSFVDYILLNEVTKNVDGYRLSTFFNKERGGKLKAGPIWDYNLAFGNANYCSGASPIGWGLNFNRSCPLDGWTINTYWDRLLTDPAFGQALIDRWTELRQGSFHTDSVLNLMNDFLVELDDAPARNFDRWPILNTWVWPNVEVGGSYQAEINYLRTWIRERLEWMDTSIPQIAKEVLGPNSRPLVRLSPNPFQESVNISITSNVSDQLSMWVLDLQGKLIRELAIERTEGYTQVYSWDGKTREGKELSAGIYLYRLTNGSEVIESGKLIKQ